MYESLKRIKTLLEQDNPDIPSVIQDLENVQRDYMESIKSAKNTPNAEPNERGNMILAVLMEQIRIDYMLGVLTGATTVSFPQYLSGALEEINVDLHPHANVFP